MGMDARTTRSSWPRPGAGPERQRASSSRATGAAPGAPRTHRRGGAAAEDVTQDAFERAQTLIADEVAAEREGGAKAASEPAVEVEPPKPDRASGREQPRHVRRHQQVQRQRGMR